MPDENTHKKANRLVNEKSPYLLQHAYNPVDWFPWGKEAFEKASSENKPVFLSIGYSTCHWCHNMARESFEDEEVAAILNRHYVPVKVDREERPDIDNIYMNVCQVMTGHGGWPLTIVMTADKIPFFAGTYFPRERKYNIPGIIEVLNGLLELWSREGERGRLKQNGKNLLETLQAWEEGVSRAALGPAMLERAAGELKRRYDSTYGGFGDAPKFPVPHNLGFLLRWWHKSGDEDVLPVVHRTLERMQRGGIFDQLGYGFHRYSVDKRWLVPHFEKMLYDQALLATAYVEAYQATGEETFAGTAGKIFTYVLEEMQDPGGGFYSAENAESEGVEGSYYVWKYDQIVDLFGEETGALVAAYYGVTREGNFEDGNNVLHIPLPNGEFARRHNLDEEKWRSTLEEARELLLSARKERVRPSLDDKILTSWNGLMISALARGARALDAELYAHSARRAAEFILHNMLVDGTLLHRYREKESAIDGFLEDYSYFVAGLLDLYEATFEPDYLQKALYLNEKMLELFEDEKCGGLSFTRADSRELPLNLRDAYDGAIPSGNSVAAQNMLRLAAITASDELEKKARRLLDSFSALLDKRPSAFTAMLSALDFALGPPQQMVLAGEPDDPNSREMVRAVFERFLPHKVFLARSRAADRQLQEICPYLEDKRPLDGGAAFYLCREYSCQAPVTDAEKLREILDSAAKSAKPLKRG